MATFRLLRMPLAYQLSSRGLSTEPAVAALRPTPVAVRTSQSDPTHHVKEDIGKIYRFPDEVKSKLFSHAYLPYYFERFNETFNETNVVVRQPALELIDFLKRADYSRPVIRYVLYGRYGCGKSLTLVHVLNYAYNNEFIIVHVPQVWFWFHWSSEVVSAERDPSIIDLPLEAVKWLKNFEKTNSNLITKLELKTTKTYEWSQREKTEEGVSLNELVSHGISRVKYGCQVIDVLLNELKHHCRNKRCKTFVGIDGYNGFFQKSSRLRTAEKVRLIPSNVSLTKSFLELVKNDWSNGAVVLVVDDHATVKGEYSSHFPFHLLRRDGVESIDPFIPINVPEFTPLEFQNYLNFLAEKRWLQNPDGVDEIEFVTQRNPRQINTYCANR